MKERIKRITPPRKILTLSVLILVALIFMMPLTGCGKKKDSNDNEADNTTAKTCDHQWEYVAMQDDDKNHQDRCDKCNTSNTEPHRFGAFISVDGEIHQRVCSDCRYILQEVHNFVNGQCTVCGQKEVTGTESDNPTNTAGHKHIWSTAWTYNRLQHWNVCTFAGGCNVVSSLANHAYILQHNAKKHWKECICGRIIEEEDHDFPQVWSTSSTQHWHVCSVCGEIADAADHTYTQGVNLQADGTSHWYLCSVCGEKIVKTVASHDNEWVKDSTDTMYHYENCKICNKKGEKKLHEYDGFWDFDCNLCGYSRYVPLPIVPEVPDGPMVPGT